MRECLEIWEKEKDEEGAAETLRCFKEYGEDIYFDDEEKRMYLAREVWDNSVKKIMEEISQILKVHSREDFIKLKEKYNLTMY
ncbi:MAG: hypothetical protein ACP5G5_01150 [Thermoplasmata archaeon]|jgi:hypothetical protein|nr:hypothetical protein [Thermoplasmatales archaeon]PMP73674.1 MAG: hypothetical protein C0180_06145 [Aciduliprofundum sp.]HEU12833.1 hypothetical protein [Euryarchaeota archaeon]